ncbi:MAG: hypothetical protein V1899_10030 [Planctomycetota bacterium]
MYRQFIRSSLTNFSTSPKKALEKAGPDANLMIYANVEALRKIQALNFRPENKQERLAWELVGLDVIQALSYSSSIKGKDFRDVFYVDIPAAARKGLLALFDGKELAADALAAAPKNSVAALALNISLEKLIDNLLALVAITPRAIAHASSSAGGGAGNFPRAHSDIPKDINALMAEKGLALNIDLRQELMNALTGQVVLSVNIPARHPKVAVGFPQPLLILKIKNVQALQNALKALRNACPNTVEFTDMRDGDNEIVVARQETVFGNNPAQIAYTIDKNDLIVSLYPLALREELHRRATPTNSLTEDLNYKAARSQLTGTPRALMYLDTAAIIVAVYDSLIPVWQMAPRDPRVNIAMLPTAALFMQNLSGNIGGLNTDANGITIERYSPISMTLVSPIAAGLILPVLTHSRESAQRTASMSNLRQFSFACTIYTDVPANGGKFPEDLTALLPDYIMDVRVFRNPRFSDQPVGYIYVAGSTPKDATNILAYENVPISQAHQGRSILCVAGNVEFVDDVQFKQRLDETKKQIEAAGGKFKLMPIDFTQIKAAP